MRSACKQVTRLLCCHCDKQSASLILVPGRVRDKAEIRRLQPVDSWGVPWTNGARIEVESELFNDWVHVRWTNGARIKNQVRTPHMFGLLGRILD